MAFCTECGNRLIEGALFCNACGTGVNLPQAERSEPSTNSPSVASYPTSPSHSASSTQTSDPPQAHPARGFPSGNRRIALLAGALAAAMLVAIIGVFAVKKLTAPRGAGSPEEAVQAFAAALVAKDPTAIAAAIAPEESRGLAKLTDHVRDMLASGKLTSKGSELSAIDLKIDGLQLRSSELSKTVARVKVTGGSIDLSAKSIEDVPMLLRPLVTENRQADLSRTQVTTGFPVVVMTVQDEGGWYVSPLYTYGEYMAMATGVQGSFPDAVPKATTEKTPEDAVKSFLKALAAADTDGAIARLTPHEQGAVQSYSRIWKPYSGYVSSEFSAEATVNKMTKEDLGGGAVAVVVESMDLSSSSYDARFNAYLEGDCLSLEAASRNSTTCALDALRGNIPADGAGTDKTTGRLVLVVSPSGDGYAVSLLGSAIASADSFAQSPDVAGTIAQSQGLILARPVVGTLGPNQHISVTEGSGPVALTVDKAGTVTITAVVDGSTDTRSLQVIRSDGRSVATDWSGSETKYQVSKGTYLIAPSYWESGSKRDLTITVGPIQ